MITPDSTEGLEGEERQSRHRGVAGNQSRPNPMGPGDSGLGQSRIPGVYIIRCWCPSLRPLPGRYNMD